MAAALDFYFDFSSPYGYLASEKIEALAQKHGRTVNWCPILLGAIFKVTGGAPLPNLPLKGDYARRDFLRSAKFHGIPMRYPSTFPISGVAPTRAVIWLKGKDPAKVPALVKALYRALFVDDINISEVDNVVKVAAAAGCDGDALRAALNDQAVKDKTKAEVDAALAKGVFGSPYIVVDGEAFWGIDRFDQIEKWIATGGW
jgi:2-hydroxychromene-2-carboxylate isomerase